MSTVGGPAKVGVARPAAQPRAGAALRDPAVLVPAGALAVAFIGVFFRWFDRQHLHSWNAPEDWGHAYLIPFISGYLVWRSRDRLAEVRAERFWPALAPFLLGVLAYFYAVVGIKNHMIQGMSVVLTLYGLLLLVLGPGVMRILFVPVAMLAFGITISERIMLEITFKLQLIASQGSYVLLSALAPVWGLLGDGFSVAVEGNTLTLFRGADVIPLNVAEACSGMRMVVAFYALAAAWAVLACPAWWQRVLLVLLAGPVAVLMNIVRVGVLGLLSIYNPSLAAGDAHTLIGTILLIPSVLLFGAIVWALRQVVREPKEGAA